MGKLFKFLIYSNLYVALPVTFLVFQTYILFNLSIDVWVLAGTYFGTLFLYNFHRLRGLNHVLRQDLSERHLWARKQKSFLITLTVFSFFVGAISAWFFISISIFIWMLPPTLLALGYVVPFLKIKNRWFRLRDLPFLKAFLIAIAVSWLTLFLPLNKFFTVEVWLVFIERFLFLLAITIPFDIRDVNFDKHSKLKTIPAYFGEQKAKLFSYLFLGFSLSISILLATQFKRPLPTLMAFLIAGLFSALVIALSKKNSSEFHYSFLVEGTMIFQTIMVWGAELYML